MSHCVAESERQLSGPNRTDFPLISERPESARLAHLRRIPAIVSFLNLQMVYRGGRGTHR
jgi:hypothetical protein